MAAERKAPWTGLAGAAKSGYAPDPTDLAGWEYTQAKEVTIVCRAVTVSTFSGTDETKFNKADYKQLVSVNKIPDFKSLDFKSENDVLGYLKYLMGGFLQSFKL